MDYYIKDELNAFITEVNTSLEKDGLKEENHRNLGALEYIYHKMFEDMFGEVPAFEIDKYGRIFLLNDKIAQ